MTEVTTLIAHQVADDDLPKIDDWKPCRVRDGNFVEPCQSLQLALNERTGRRGLELVEWSNFVTATPTRSFVVIRSGVLGGKGGVVVNHCPFCGVEICDPVRSEEEKQGEIANA